MKFNVLTRKKTVVKNYEGASAYKMSPQMELYAAVVTAALSDNFYESGNDKLERIKKLIAMNEAAFVAGLAIYAREKMYLRSIPLVLTVELAKLHTGDSLVSKLTERVIQRADEITELLAYYISSNARTDLKKLNRLSKQIQKGLAGAFNKFDAYQFAKYNRKADVTLRDALFLVHPKAKDENQQSIFDNIVKDELEVPYTWETELSALGQIQFANAEEKNTAVKLKWQELIRSGKLGYMAMLRNLRNILEAGVDHESVEKVCSYLSNEKAVAKSKQLPFRFLAAYRELKNVQSGYAGSVMQALEAAVKLSIKNMEGFDAATRVVIACDVSGSMQKAISAKSSILNFDIGLLLGMLLQSKCRNVLSGMFGERWKTIQLPGDSVLSNVDAFYKREGEVGYSTNGYLVIRDLLKKQYIADKIMLFTDCQMWNSNASATNDSNALKEAWLQYKKIAPAAKLYLFDLAGYGNTPLNILSGDVFLIAGWSDKVFDVLKAIENGSDAIAEIMKMEV